MTIQVRPRVTIAFYDGKKPDISVAAADVDILFLDMKAIALIDAKTATADKLEETLTWVRHLADDKHTSLVHDGVVEHFAKNGMEL